MRTEAEKFGFDAVRIVRPDALLDAPEQLRKFLAEGRHGDMGWLAEKTDWRADPRKLWPEVRSIAMLAVNYGPEGDALATLSQKSAGNISVYARHRDYHDILKGRLKLLGNALLARARKAGIEGDIKVFVDTAPVMEKPLAMAAGLGWAGKHSNLVSKNFGSWLFLGSIFTTLDLPADAPETDHCGSCSACRTACPTGALDQPYKIDARLCISYLTIESKSQIPRNLREDIGNRIYGCDDCLAVCPWNKFAKISREIKLLARPELIAPELKNLAALDDENFRTFFSGSPVKRIGHARFLRNVLAAIGNSGDKSLIASAQNHLDHAEVFVRGMAVWALSRLMDGQDFARLAARRGPEPDEQVRAEWILASEQGDVACD